MDSDLRRADWRFLLPRPVRPAFQHLVLLGTSTSLFDRMARLGIADRVSSDPAETSSADVVGLLEGGQVELTEALRCLAPGGTLYCEIARRWTSLFRTMPGAIRRRLAAAGLETASVHYARPNFRQAAIYLPLGAQGVLSWYIATLLRPRGAGSRIARTFLRLLAWTGDWSLHLAPRYVVTAIAGQRHRSASGVAPSVPLGSVGTDSALAVVMLGGADPSRRVILFAFSPGAREPSSVVKLWRLPDRNAKAEAEQATLVKIRSLLDPDLARTLPRPLGTARCGDLVAGVESYAPGQSLSFLTESRGRPQRRRVEAIRLVLDWLGKFHRQAQVSRQPWDQSALERLVELPLSNYRAAFGSHPDERRLFDFIRQRAKTLIGVPLPIVWAHPDLTGANVLVQGRRITVIDWSGAIPRLPLFDLLSFVVLVASGPGSKRRPEARLRRFREIFILSDRPEGTTLDIRAAVWRYMKSLEIDPRFFPMLLTMAWVSRSLESFERERSVERGEPGANPHPGESYVDYVRILAESREELFSLSPAPWWSEE
jgi:Ser/Thr protein kinase RdoA (MazF antagonist)